MKNILVPTLLLLMLAYVVPTNAQQCQNFHKRRCEGSDDVNMRYNNQSKSGMFVLGHTSDLVFVAHAGKDYRISLCQDSKVEEPIKFKVIDSRSKEVLFDSEQASLDVPVEEGDVANDGAMPFHFEFSCDVTKKIIVRITAPGPPPSEDGGKKKGKREEPDPEDLFCVGVLLENMDTPKLGF